MTKSTRKAVVVLSGILAVIIIIGTLIVGVARWRNRWHKIDFQVESITVQNVKTDSFGKDEYFVTVKGTAQTWFYDFNTYQFDFSGGLNGGEVGYNADYGETLTVNHKDKTPFELSFYTYGSSTALTTEILNYTFYAVNILKDGKPNDAIDIRLFMSDYADLFSLEQSLT